MSKKATMVGGIMCDKDFEWVRKETTTALPAKNVAIPQKEQKLAHISVRCKMEMDERLKIYELLYKAYADEIKNLWQRSIFLGAFMTLAWGGYGALQLKFMEKCVENSQLPSIFHFASLGLCAVIIILSLLWIAMAKGSKFVQEAHEDKIDKFNFMDRDINNIFCNLDDYKPKQDKSSPNLLFCGGLDENFKSFRYSPSKINIVLGWFSAVIATILCIVHTIFAMQKYCEFVSSWAVAIIVLIIVASLIAICLMPCFIKIYLKGGKQGKKYVPLLIRLLRCVCRKVSIKQRLQNFYKEKIQPKWLYIKEKICNKIVKFKIRNKKGDKVENQQNIVKKSTKSRAKAPKKPKNSKQGAKNG